MHATRQGKQDKDIEQHKREALNALIGKQVVHTLGVPCDLLTVQVRPLWEGHYRINVFVGAHAASAKVAHSFFLEADSDGAVIASTPKITRRY
jgi:hypothetical protein